MRMNKFLAAAVGAVSLLSASLVAYGASSASTSSSGNKYHHDEKGRDHEQGRPHFDQILNLTDAQKKTLKDQRTTQKPVEQALHEKIRAAHEALDKAGDNNADDAALNQLANDLAALIAQEEVARVKDHQFFLSVLTPEQKQVLTQWESEHKHDFPEHRKHP